MVVSCYFQMRRRDNDSGFEGDIRDFVRDAHVGIRKIVAFYNAFDERASRLPAYGLLRYEDLQKDLVAGLAKAAALLGAEGIGRSHIEAAASDSGFDRMYRMQLEHGSARLAPGDPRDPDSYKVRRGVVGGYLDYLDDADVEYVDAEVRKCRLYRASS